MNIRTTPGVTQATDGFARRIFTVRDVVGMMHAGILGEDEKFELIEGEIVPMSPKGNQHEVIKLALNRLLAAHAPEDLRLGVETTVYLSMTSLVEPDLCLYSKTILPEDVRGHHIVLAIEVAGTSLGYDKRLKAKLYASHGVQELWVIDAKTRVTWVHTQPQFDGSWGRVDERAPDDELTIAALPGVRVVVAKLD